MIAPPPDTRAAVAAGLAFIAACLALGLALRLAAEGLLLAAAVAWGTP